MTKTEVILYTGKPLLYDPVNDTEETSTVVVSAIEGKYKTGLITLQHYFTEDKEKDEDSEVEIEITRDIIKQLYVEYCLEDLKKE